MFERYLTGKLSIFFKISKMKNVKLIILLSILINYEFSFGQTDIGLNITGNYCGIWGPDKPQNFTPNWGYGGGGYLNFNSSSTLSPIIELNYAHRTFDFTEPIILLDNSSLNVLEKNDFIEIPLMIKFQKSDGVFSSNILLGWQASFLLYNEQILSASSDGHIITATDYYDFKNNFYEYGFLFGAGFQYRNYILQGRYYFAMRNIHGGDISREMRYNTLSVSLGYQLNYKPPKSFRKYSFWRELKYKIQRKF